MVEGFVLVISSDETVQRWDGFFSCAHFFLSLIVPTLSLRPASRRRGMGIRLLAGQAVGQSVSRSVSQLGGWFGEEMGWISFK